VKHTDRMKLRICIQFYSNFVIQSCTGRHLFCVPHTLWNIYRKWPHKYSMLSLLVSIIHDWNFQRTKTQAILIKFPMTQSANSSHIALILHKNKLTNFYHHIPDNSTLNINFTSQLCWTLAIIRDISTIYTISREVYLLISSYNYLFFKDPWQGLIHYVTISWMTNFNRWKNIWSGHLSLIRNLDVHCHINVCNLNNCLK
jgi:hypothetical protein